MLIYVCAPYDGSQESFLLTQRAMGYVVKEGHTPISPYGMLWDFVNSSNPAEVEQLIQAALKMIEICDQIWVFGVEKEAPPNDYKFRFTKTMTREFIQSRALKKQFRDCTEVL